MPSLTLNFLEVLFLSFVALPLCFRWDVFTLPWVKVQHVQPLQTLNCPSLFNSFSHGLNQWLKKIKSMPKEMIWASLTKSVSRIVKIYVLLQSVYGVVKGPFCPLV
jgi:hypothetical protein